MCHSNCSRNFYQFIRPNAYDRECRPTFSAAPLSPAKRNRYKWALYDILTKDLVNEHQCRCANQLAMPDYAYSPMIVSGCNGHSDMYHNGRSTYTRDWGRSNPFLPYRDKPTRKCEFAKSSLNIRTIRTYMAMEPLIYIYIINYYTTSRTNKRETATQA